MATEASKKLFLVSLTIRLGDYEKNVDSFIEAMNKADAEFIALCNETHNEPLTREEFDQGKDWWDDYMVYYASATELPEELALTINKYNQYPLRLIKSS